MGGGNPLKKVTNKAFDYIGDLTGSNAAADAAQGAASAQQAEARRQRAEMRRMTEPVTIESMAQMDQALKYQERSLARQEQLISQIDPTIMEASQQALRLLKGETSTTLAPLQRQRDLQRQKLMNQLREQLGPGAETSTAGIQALTRFDSETSSMFAGAQQGALGNLASIFGQFSSQKPSMLQEAMGFGQLARGRADLRFQQANAMQGVNAAVLGSSGAEYTGQLMRAQSQQALANKAIEGGIAYATGGASAMGGMGKMTPSGGGDMSGGTGGSVGGNSNPFGMSEGYGKF